MQSLPPCRYGQARRRGRMLMPKVDFLQLLVVRAVVGRLASGEPSSPALPDPAEAQPGSVLAAGHRDALCRPACCKPSRSAHVWLSHISAAVSRCCSI